MHSVLKRYFADSQRQEHVLSEQRMTSARSSEQPHYALCLHHHLQTL